MDTMSDKEAALEMIRTMLSGYPGSASGIKPTTPKAYWMLLTDIPLEIIGKACRSLMEEIPPRKFAPNASELHARARLFMPPEPGPTLYTGIMDVDFGHRRIDMRGLTPEQQEEVFRTKRAPERITALPSLKRI